MKKIYLFVLLLAAVSGTEAQTVLTIQGAATGTPTLYITNGAYLNVTGGIKIEQVGSPAGANNDYVQNNGTIKILSDGTAGQSDFENNVTGLKTFTTGQTTGEVIFAADNETQTIKGGGTVEFMNLTVNNSLPPALSLEEDVTVNGILKIGGIIKTQSNNLTLTSSGSLAGSPFTSGNMIQVDGSGQFIREVNAGVNSYLFPIGDGAPAYSPVTIDFVSNTNAGAVGLNVKPVAHPQINNPTNATDYIKRYWTFSNTGLSNYSYTGTFQYLSTDIIGNESGMKLNRWASPWYAHTGSSAASNTLTVTSALNEAIAPLSGDFTGRNPECVAQNITITALRDTICSRTPGILSANGASGIIQWQSSVTAGNFSDISAATDASYISAVTQNTYYRLYAKSGACTDTSSVFSIVVKPSPVADYTADKTGLTVSFDSSPSSNDVTSFNWEFGDGATSTEPHPSHTYTNQNTYHVCLTVYNGSNCSFTTCRDILLTGITKISAEKSFKIYPNPFSNNIFIDGEKINQRIESIEVYDLLGKKIYSQPTLNPKPQTLNLKLDLTYLSKGMYYLKIKTGGTIHVEPLVKQ